jgi:hypothetical protein
MQGKVAVSEDGSHSVLSVDPRIYPLETVYSAAYVFLDRAYILLEGDPKKEIRVLVRPKGGGDPERMGMDFFNELLSYARYFSSVRENSEVTRMIIQRALFSAEPGLAQEMEDKEIEDLIKELEEEEEKGRPGKAAGGGHDGKKA